MQLLIFPVDLGKSNGNLPPCSYSTRKTDLLCPTQTALLLVCYRYAVAPKHLVKYLWHKTVLKALVVCSRPSLMLAVSIIRLFPTPTWHLVPSPMLMTLRSIVKPLFLHENTKLRSQGSYAHKKTVHYMCTYCVLGNQRLRPAIERNFLV